MNYVAGVIAKISRSNALYPLLISLCLTVSLSIATVTFNAPLLIQVISAICVVAIIWKIVTSFDYLMRTNPNMLRSETHVTQMKALELLGDNLHGTSTTPADVISILNPHDVVELPEENQKKPEQLDE